MGILVAPPLLPGTMGTILKLSVLSSYTSLSLSLSISLSLSLSPLSSLSLSLSLSLLYLCAVCDVSLDIVFMLDRSGSVGEENFDTAIAFLQNVVEFFTIAIDSTRVR